ncbi:hypothetical protein M3223_06075 [Paenibacillus pasadenensis]|uniref:hypothetical protein n=1 Tax=Paenibacillus pasadenensis TaxID=217090 RepID=UPI00203E19E2|nr:hypothetical protein [Paenibacillus pasadenensis]MCM3746920.1 hypothetical protein [Paenibacillus pasadenensis]
MERTSEADKGKATPAVADKPAADPDKRDAEPRDSAAAAPTPANVPSSEADLQASGSERPPEWQLFYDAVSQAASRMRRQ